MENVMMETKEEPKTTPCTKTTACIHKVFLLQLPRLETTLAVVYNAYSFIVISALCRLLATKIQSG